MPLRRGTTGRRGAAGRLVWPAMPSPRPWPLRPLRPLRLMFMRVGALRRTGARRQARTTAVPLALTISIPLDCPSTS